MLTSEVALEMIAASHERARELGTAVSTAIVDADGRLFAFSRMEGSMWASVDVAQAKAYTGSALQRDGEALVKMSPATVANVSSVLGGLVPVGSVTLVHDGDQLIASIGCSGSTDDDDGECARAARDAYHA